MTTVRIIAEAGVNHNGSLERALAMVDAAAACGADVVKFQTFSAERLVTRRAPKAGYQQVNAPSDDGAQFQMLKALELDDTAHRTLIERCRQRGISFLSTPFDLQSMDYLVGELGVEELKLSSGEITNPLMLLAAARSGARIILSTGMATLGEVEEMLGVVAFGLLGGGAPSRGAFREAWADSRGRDLVRSRVTVLHCTTEYPAPPAEVNLRAMGVMGSAFGVPMGYSDHTAGAAISIAAAALGAVMLEKHFTLDRTLSGPDHVASVEPKELAELVSAVRQVEAALGDGVKVPTASERGNIAAARKSLTTARSVAAGEVLTADALVIKRPGTGASPMEYWDRLGHPALRAYAADETLDP